MIDMQVTLPSSCADVGEIEEALYLSFQEVANPDVIIVDMSEVVYITAPCLIYLVAFAKNLLKNKYDVKFGLPRDIYVRNVLRIWRFPIVIKEATGKSFASMVRIEDLRYFGESQMSGDYYDFYYRKFASGDEGLAELMKKDFFSLISVPFSTDIEKSMAIDSQYSKWSEEIIKSILKRHLVHYYSENENLIPNRIIYECMTNAFRHSDAVKLVTGAYFDKIGHVLTISYWDDGESIVSTLEKALLENNVVRNKNLDGFDQDIHFSIEVKSNTKEFYKKKYYHSDNDPTTNSSRTELLLASFSPGVSRDPFGKDKYQGNPFSKFNKPGMGLTTLLNAVIDLLGGTLAVRTDSFFVNFKKPSSVAFKKYREDDTELKHETLYKAKLLKYNERMPVFNGNMITIRLPLKH